MAVTIVVLNADTKPPPSITFDAPRVVIGRGEGADVRLPDPSVSHRHASLRQRGSDYLVVDEGSTNGTFVGSVRLAPQSPRVLRHGERIRVGRIELEVRIEHGVPISQSSLATRELALGLVSAALAAQGEMLAVVVRARTQRGDQETSFELELTELGHEYVLGRGQRCDLVLDDADCSRRHLGITRRGNGLFVRDLGSKNGTRLDAKQLPARQEIRWPEGQTLHIGEVRLEYEDGLAEALEELERAADEPITETPPGARLPPDLGSPDESPGATEELMAETHEAHQVTSPGAATEIARQSQGPRRRPLDPALTDFLVGLLALGMLALSLLGLYWLLGS